VNRFIQKRKLGIICEEIGLKLLGDKSKLEETKLIKEGIFSNVYEVLYQKIDKKEEENLLDSKKKLF
jgi:hypothetical protein